MSSCPLCGGHDCGPYHSDSRRDYELCARCKLVYVPEQYYLDPSDEKAEYDKHENSITDEGYRRFLSRLCDPVCEHLAPGSKGLDFGCGPGPALAAMMRERGFAMDIYDIFYAQNPQVFHNQYDFITVTEVVEHLHCPGRELSRLWSLLSAGGWLGVMTKRVRDCAAFATWHYKNDPTHVCFFSEATFEWLASQWGASLIFPDADVVLLQKR